VCVENQNFEILIIIIPHSQQLINPQLSSGHGQGREGDEVIR
jgi:hypothetical protein